MANTDIIQMPPPNSGPPPLMQVPVGPPPDNMMGPPPPGFGPPGTQNWSNDDFGKPILHRNGHYLYNTFYF